MKYSAVLLMVLALSCTNRVTYPAPIETAPPSLQVAYSLTDTLYNPKSTFRSGEIFILSFSMSNQTGKDLSCWESAKLDDMLIYLNDSVVAYNHYGQTFPAGLWVNTTMANGSVISDFWRGPNALGRGFPPITLSPGEYNYRIVVNIDFDDTVKVVTKPYSTQFVIIQ